MIAKKIDMCQGPLFGKMFAYTIPLALAGILQLLYNAADLVVVGQFAGSDAFAAVGATGSINSLFFALFFGLSGGASICVAQYYGARDAKNVCETVHTSILVSVIVGIVIAIFGVIFIKDALRLMGTPEDILDLAATYMKIIFAAAPFTMFYNFAAGIIRASGDTKRPFYILIITGLLNVILNLITVIIFHMSVVGVALATAVGAVLNAVLAGIILVKSDDIIRLSFRRLKIFPDKLVKIFHYGVPAGIQSILFGFSNVLIQSAVNSFDSVVIVAGNAAAAQVEGFVYTSMNSVYQTALNFSGQNYGAKQYKRITKVLVYALIMVTAIGVVMGVGAYLLGTPLLSIYQPDNPGAIEVGLIRMSIISVLYFLCGNYEVILGTLRGIGMSWVPTIVTLVCVGGVRIGWILFVFPKFHTLKVLFYSYPITWILSITILMTIYVIKHPREKTIKE